MNKLTDTMLFYISSSNFDEIKDSMYGYTISKDGNNLLVTTNEFHKNILSGLFISIKKKDDHIYISQDEMYSLYIYYYVEDDFYALSNSIYLLAENLIKEGKHLTFDKLTIDEYFQSGLRTYALYDTIINEIKIVPIFNDIELTKTSLMFIEHDAELNKYDITTKEGIDILDRWLDKWENIIHNLISSGVYTRVDLSGGFDSRTIFSLVHSSVDTMNVENINIFSKNEGNKGMIMHLSNDFEIATEITDKLGLKVNEHPSKIKSFRYTGEQQFDMLKNLYMGVHKEGYYTVKHNFEPMIHFGGINGELIRGNHEDNYEQTKRKFISNNPIRNLKEVYEKFDNDMKYLESISKTLYEANIKSIMCTLSKSHFGLTVYKALLENMYNISPFFDIDLVKLHVPEGFNKDMVFAMIIYRTTPELMTIRFTHNEKFSDDVIKKVIEVCNKYPRIKKCYENLNVIFNPAYDFMEYENSETYSGDDILYKKFVEGKDLFIKTFTKLYDSDYATKIYDYANEYYLNKDNYFRNKWINCCTTIIEMQKILNDI